LAHAQTVVPLILDYRECSKIKSSFCDPLACNLRNWFSGKQMPAGGSCHSRGERPIASFGCSSTRPHLFSGRFKTYQILFLSVTLGVSRQSNIQSEPFEPPVTCCHACSISLFAFSDSTFAKRSASGSVSGDGMGFGRPPSLDDAPKRNEPGMKLICCVLAQATRRALFLGCSRRSFSICACNSVAMFFLASSKLLP
jgi:hypothetical protein